MTDNKLQVIPLGGLGEFGMNSMAIRYGDDIIVVDAGMMFPDDELMGVDIVTPDFAYLEQHSAMVRGVILTHGHEDHIGGNERLAASGISVAPGRGVATVGTGQGARAEIIAHEQVLNRISLPGTATPMPIGLWPTSTFSARRKEFFFNNEGIQIIHQPSAHTDGDAVVYFRRSDVVAAGDVYVTTSYPVIDAQRGGSIQGVLDGLNFLLELVVSGEKTEGGTMIVPGHGRISDEADLVEYRDMVTIIRDRIQDMAKKGMTVEQVKAARPTLDFDALFGAAPGWTPTQFVEAVYRDLRSTRVTQSR